MHPILADRRRIGLYLAAWVPLAALLAVVLATYGGSAWGEAALLGSTMAVISAFLCLAAWYPCRALPLGGTPLPAALASQVAAALATATLWLALGWGVAHTFTGGAGRVASQAAPLLAVGALLYLLSAAVHYLLASFEASRAAERRALEAELAARGAELAALRAQLDPHFLFNSLNSISARLTTDAEAARLMCVQLADFLRHSLRLGRLTTTPLADEIQLLEHYLAVERGRFGERLQVELHVDRDVRDCSVPPLLLQPLVENALKHGVASLVDGGLVRVAARRRGDRLKLTVTNPFDADQPARSSTGTGLANVRARLATLHGPEARLRTRAEGGVYTAEITLPADRTGGTNAAGGDDA